VSSVVFHSSFSYFRKSDIWGELPACRAHLASSTTAASPFGGEAASSSKRFVDIIKARVKGTTAPTNAPPASHAHRPVNRQTTTLQRKQMTANDVCQGAARL
jgi:hypothetical protein